MINGSNLSYLTLHFRLSSLFYLNQLVDIFAYETSSKVVSGSGDSYSTVIVYNFHSVISQTRTFVFTQNNLSSSTTKLNGNVSSISDYYPAANWLEPEAAELSSVTFHGRKDLRNLMLQYGETSSPLKKSFPSIGYKEVFYSPNVDMVVQKEITVNL